MGCILVVVVPCPLLNIYTVASTHIPNYHAHTHTTHIILCFGQSSVVATQVSLPYFLPCAAQQGPGNHRRTQQPKKRATGEHASPGTQGRAQGSRCRSTSSSKRIGARGATARIPGPVGMQRDADFLGRPCRIPYFLLGTWLSINRPVRKPTVSIPYSRRVCSQGRFWAGQKSGVPIMRSRHIQPCISASQQGKLPSTRGAMTPADR